MARGDARGIEGVEGADEGQPLDDRAGDPGAVPEVAQARVGLAGDDALHLGVADALDLAERAADGRGRAAAGRPVIVAAPGEADGPAGRPAVVGSGTVGRCLLRPPFAG